MFFTHRRGKRSKTSATSRPSKASSRRPRLRLETLEERRMLAMLANVGTADDVIFNVPAGAEGIFVEDDGIVGNGRSRIRSASGHFDTTPFVHPVGSLTINVPSSDSVHIQFKDSLGSADLAVHVSETGPVNVGYVHTFGDVAINTQGLIVEYNPDDQPDIVAADLSLIARTGIGESGNPLETSVSRIEGVTDTGGIFIKEADALLVGNVSSELNGLVVHSSGSIDLVAGGDISLSDAWPGFVRAGVMSGDVRITALQTNAAITTNGGTNIVSPIGNVTLTSDRMMIREGGDLLAGQEFQLKPYSAGRPIMLGSRTDASDALELWNDEISNITTRVLRIGSATTGDIVFADRTTVFPADYLSLHTGGEIIDNYVGDQPTLWVSGPGLAMRAQTGIGSTDSLDLFVHGGRLAFLNAAESVGISSHSGLKIVALDGLATSANDGTTTAIAAAKLDIETDVKTTGNSVYRANDGPVWVRNGKTLEVTQGDLILVGGASLAPAATFRAAGVVDFFGSASIKGTVDSGVGVPLVRGSLGISYNEAVDENGNLIGANLPDGIRVEGTGQSSVFVSDKLSSAPRTWTVSDQLITLDGEHIPFSGISSVYIYGGQGPDRIALTASDLAIFDVQAGLPVGNPPVGDSLELDITGRRIVEVSSYRHTSHGYFGTYSLDNGKYITFTSVESLSPIVDLQVSTTNIPSTTAPGSTLTYQLDYGNAGMLWADGVVLTEVLPPGTTFDAALSTPGWTETEPGSGIFRLVIGRLEGGETGSAVFAVTVNDPLPSGQREIANVAIIVDEGGLHDPMPEDNWSTSITEVDYPGIAYAVAADAGGGPHVRAFSAGGQERFSFFAYAAHFTGGVRVAMGDVTNDGTPDIITAAGPGGGPHVRVFDGETGQQVPGAIGSFFAYDSNFTGGVFLASADFNDDGHADIVTSTGAGGSRQVRVFSGADGSVLLNAVEDPKFEGELRVATGDITGDGTPDIISAIGAGSFEAEVHVFDGTSGQPIAGNLASLVAYPGFFGGAYVASGDVDGDGRDDIITGAGAGGGPHVKAFSGVDGSLLASFFAYDAGFRGGVRVSTSDIGDDGRIELLTAAGPGGGPHVRAFALDGLTEVTSFFAFGANFTGGVFVAGGVQPSVDQSIEAVQQTALRNNALGSELGWDTTQSAGSLDKATLESQTLDAEVLPLTPDRVDNLLGAFVEDQWSLPIVPEPLVEPERAPLDTFWETVVEVGL